MTTRKPGKASKPRKSARTAKAGKALKPLKPRKATRPAASVYAPVFSDEHIDKILKLLKGSNTVELKLVVPLKGHRATITSIGLDPVEAQPRQAYFFDTPDLVLNKAGLIVRARRIQGGRADTVVKLRPVEPSTIDPRLRRSASFKVELDAMPGGFVCSASFKGTCTGEEVQNVTTGAAPLKSLFSTEQLAFYAAHAPKGLGMQSLVPLGPTFLLKAKHQPKSFDRRITVELWLYPDGARILEISTKCLPEEWFLVGAQFKAYLANQGITLGVSQETKTKAALEFFSARLSVPAPPAAEDRARA